MHGRREIDGRNTRGHQHFSRKELGGCHHTHHRWGERYAGGSVMWGGWRLFILCGGVLGNGDPLPLPMGTRGLKWMETRPKKSETRPKNPKHVRKSLNLARKIRNRLKNPKSSARPKVLAKFFLEKLGFSHYLRIFGHCSPFQRVSYHPEVSNGGCDGNERRKSWMNVRNQCGIQSVR